MTRLLPLAPCAWASSSIRRQLVPVALWALCGCVSPPEAEVPEPRSLGAEFPAYAAAAAPAPSSPSASSPSTATATLARTPTAPSAPETPTGIVEIEDALAAALLRNPDLAAFSWEVRSREARALQAGLLPNPQVQVQVQDFAGTGDFSGVDGTESQLFLSQQILTAGKRSKRREAAARGADVAAWEYETARVDVFATVVRTFFAALAAQRRVELSEELVRVAETSADEVRQLVSRGATPRAELMRAEVEAAAARVDVAIARRARRAARAALAATWGAGSPDFTQLEGDLGAIDAPPDDAEPMQNRLSGNPELVRWEREIARRKAVVSREDAERIPDVTVGIGPRWLAESDDAAFFGQVSVPIPIFDRNQGGRAAARSDLRKAEHERRAAFARLAAALESAHQELAARFEEVTSLREEILPGAEGAFEQVRRGYAQGLFRNVDVLQAQRRLFELRLREIDALRAYHAARSNLERITGTPLSTSLSTPGGTRP